MVYDINMKNVIKHLSRKAMSKINDEVPGRLNEEELQWKRFALLMKSCFNSFFVRINFKERPIYLYRYGDKTVEDIAGKSLRNLGTFHNQYLKKLIFHSGVDSGVVDQNYFLIVEVSLAFKKKKRKKVFFKDSEEFIQILMDQA